MRQILTILACACACTLFAQPHSDVFGMTLEDGGAGPRVIAVAAGSVAERAGIRIDDTVETVGRTQVANVAAMFDRLEKSGDEFVVTFSGPAGRKVLSVRRPNITGHIVFQSNRAGNTDIYAMNADGSGITRLTDTSDNEANPVRSPDGKKIAFTLAREGLFLELCTMDKNGARYRDLSNTPSAETLPRWAPDGKSIYFLANQNQKWQVFRTPWNRFDPTPIVETSPDQNNMAWTYPAFDVSPDGRRLVVPGLRDGNNFDDAIFDLTTGQPHDFAVYLPSKIRPSWSKDGKRMIANAPTPFIVDTISDTATPLKLQPGEAELIASITWSPSGSYLLVAMRPARDEPTQLYVMSADGSNRTRLTFSTSDDQFADWTGEKKGR
jgi:TolB protein